MSGDWLRPCPFCGGGAQRVKSSGRWGWFVSCSCAAVGPSASTRQLAVRRWNERREPQQMDMLDALEGTEDGDE